MEPQSDDHCETRWGHLADHRWRNRNNQSGKRTPCSFETRYYISCAPLDIERLSAGVRGHWGVESMHWLLDVAFKDDLSRYRTGHGAKGATHFATAISFRVIEHHRERVRPDQTMAYIA